MIPEDAISDCVHKWDIVQNIDNFTRQLLKTN